jgi:LmbE family N-acetylglucosaminyl deacetylase
LLTQSTHYHSIFISPHLDDIAFSCGGTLWRLCQKNRILVVNVFSDYGSKTTIRRQEEENAARFFGYESLCLDLPDFPLREWFGWSVLQRNRVLTEQDRRWADRIAGRLKALMRGIEYQWIYLPLGVGLHRDHQICFQAGVQAFSSVKALFYEDAPYALNPAALKKRCDTLAGSSFWPELVEITDCFENKMQGALYYQSQLRGCFGSEEDMRRRYREFHAIEQSAKGSLHERIWRVCV